ncbi:hypothetical protein AB6D11_18520 [Vibrio splendidus]
MQSAREQATNVAFKLTDSTVVLMMNVDDKTVFVQDADSEDCDLLRGMVDANHCRQVLVDHCYASGVDQLHTTLAPLFSDGEWVFSDFVNFADAPLEAVLTR